MVFATDDQPSQVTTHHTFTVTISNRRHGSFVIFSILYHLYASESDPVEKKSLAVNGGGFSSSILCRLLRSLSLATHVSNNFEYDIPDK